MNSKLFMVALCLTGFLSCTDSLENGKTKENAFNSANKPKDVGLIQVGSEKSELKSNPEENALFIGRIEKFYSQDEGYIPLYFINNYTDSAVKELEQVKEEVIFEDAGERRVKLNEQIVKKHLRTDKLEKLVIFGDNQEVTDTVNRVNFELYEAEIESLYIATYEIKSNQIPATVISLEGLDKVTLNRSPEFTSDSIALKNILKRNSFYPTTIYFYGSIRMNEDTISCLSFAGQNMRKAYLYLFKNGFPTDSVMNDFVVTEMNPVPLASINEVVYIASVQVPETDLRWDYLTGINLNTFQFQFYERNRKVVE